MRGRETRCKKLVTANGSGQGALQAQGFRVLRFWNDEVMRELDSVCNTIIAFARDRSLRPWR